MPIRLSNIRKTQDAVIGADGLDSAQVSTIASGVGIQSFDTLDSLPISSLTAGDRAFVKGNKRLYISNGSGWYNVSLINLAPQFDSNINSAFSIVDSQTPLIITNPASDSDNPDAIITYGGTLSDSGQYLIALTRDSSVWTFTPLSADSVYSNVTLGNLSDSNGGDFTYTFTASDGINQASKQVTITYDGLANTVSNLQGSNFGYSSAGKYLPGGTNYNIIDKFPFASDANATDVGDLLQFRFQQAGQSSLTHGYTSGGASPTIRNTISKHSFPSDGNATDVGDLTQARSAGAGTYSTTHGYTHGGQNPAPTGRNEIDKFPFAADGNATDVGDLTESMSNTSGSSSTTHGYRAGGGLPMVVTIDKYSFTSDGDATDVGDMQHGPPAQNRQASGNQSSTHGYSSSGMFGSGSSSPAGVYKTNIGSFPFASDTNGTKVGDLATGRRLTGGTSSTVSGYTAGGQTVPGAASKNEIEKWPFASDGTATDVGDLTQARYGCAGSQY